jgi:hypothetical protein
MLTSHPMADPLWESLTSFDAEALGQIMAPDSCRWLNLNDRESDRETTLGLLAFEGSHLVDPTFLLRRELATSSGFVLIFEMGYRIEETRFAAVVCLLVEATDTEITRIDEFVDGERVRPLIDSLASGRPN